MKHETITRKLISAILFVSKTQTLFASKIKVTRRQEFNLVYLALSLHLDY